MLAAVAAAAGGEVPTAGAESEVPAVAVVRFENPTGNLWWSEEGQRRTQDLLIQTLQGLVGERYRILDRTTLEERMQEEGLLPPAGRLTPAAAVKIGRVLGVRHVVTGSVVEYGAGTKAGRRRLFGLLPGQHFVVSLSLRAIDGRTGRLEWADGARASAPPADDWVAGTESEADALQFERLAAPLLETLAGALAREAFQAGDVEAATR